MKEIYCINIKTETCNPSKLRAYLTILEVPGKITWKSGVNPTMFIPTPEANWIIIDPDLILSYSVDDDIYYYSMCKYGECKCIELNEIQEIIGLVMSRWPLDSYSIWSKLKSHEQGLERERWYIGLT